MTCYVACGTLNHTHQLTLIRCNIEAHEHEYLRCSDVIELNITPCHHVGGILHVGLIVDVHIFVDVRLVEHEAIVCMETLLYF